MVVEVALGDLCVADWLPLTEIRMRLDPRAVSVDKAAASTPLLEALVHFEFRHSR